VRSVFVLCIIAAVLCPLVPAGADACTTFCFQHEGQWIFGRNFDWMVEDGLVIVNKRNVSKEAQFERNPARWTSRYGSVTFNQYGREYPQGGMNEAGLVVESMWLNGTEYPAVDDRPELAELQWIQYQLDTAASVEEVIASDSEVRISTEHASPIHFLACDRDGHCASVEFLSGEMVVHTGKSMPFTALTNNTYKYSTAFLKSVDGSEGSDAFGIADFSLKRFYWAAEGVRDYDLKSSGPPVEYAFGILQRVAQDHTQWSIVYDPANRRIHFFTSSEPSVRSVDVSAFDFSCSAAVRILDMSHQGEGDVTGAFVDYTYEANYDQIHKAFRGTDFLRGIPDEVLRSIARYPEMMECTE
jgi:penicillin V acylase-like amidase (Ntn superfamily)